MNTQAVVRVFSIGGYLCCLAGLAQATDSLPSRPNIIVIFTDDQAYNDLGCFVRKTIRTSHLDQMAAEGLRLASFYAQPVCGVRVLL